MVIRDTGRDEQEKDNSPQYPQQVHTHLIAYLAQILRLTIQHAPESGAHADQSQGLLQVWYICKGTSMMYIAGGNTVTDFGHQPCMMQPSNACSG
jgi:hypothetical protein